MPRAVGACSATPRHLDTSTARQRTSPNKQDFVSFVPFVPLRAPCRRRVQRDTSTLRHSTARQRASPNKQHFVSFVPFVPLRAPCRRRVQRDTSTLRHLDRSTADLSEQTTLRVLRALRASSCHVPSARAARHLDTSTPRPLDRGSLRTNNTSCPSCPSCLFVPRAVGACSATPRRFDTSTARQLDTSTARHLDRSTAGLSEQTTLRVLRALRASSCPVPSARAARHLDTSTPRPLDSGLSEQTTLRVLRALRASSCPVPPARAARHLDTSTPRPLDSGPLRTNNTSRPSCPSCLFVPRAAGACSATPRHFDTSTARQRTSPNKQHFVSFVPFVPLRATCRRRVQRDTSTLRHLDRSTAGLSEQTTLRVLRALRASSCPVPPARAARHLDTSTPRPLDSGPLRTNNTSCPSCPSCLFVPRAVGACCATPRHFDTSTARPRVSPNKQHFVSFVPFVPLRAPCRRRVQRDTSTLRHLDDTRSR